jgi:type I restriction enzyme S subunit
MNADRLLAQFERISEAPDAIARLRRFILDLAVRGKLVEQDPEDEPAEELLKRIAVEKVRLVKTGEMKRGKVLPPIEEDKLSFDLPSAWAFTRLGDLIHLVSGQHLQPHEYTENSWDGLPYITGPSDFADEGLRISRFALVRKAVAKKGQLLLTVKGSGVGKATTCNLPEVAISRQLMALMAIGWDDRFLILIANRLAVQLRNAARSLIPGISREDVEEFAFPLPPLVEQHRIVAKVDELMALCDQLEAARNQREQGRDRLVAATLQRLNQPAENLESFRKDASFTLQVLPSLTASTAQIKQLRQTILNLAVRGKLVEQDPEDEPAEELVERILSHPWLKKRAKPQPAFADKAKTVMRIPVPDSWTWTTIESLLPPNETVTYGILKPVWVESGVPTVRVTEMKTGAIDVDRLPRCDQSRADKFQKTTLKEGDLLISKDGTIGKTAFVPAALTGGNITQHVLRLPLSTLLSKEYIRFSIDSPWCQTYMSGETKGVALQGVNVGDFRKMPIPLPPLAEQHRIVAKVDELMALCDQLEQQLSQADQQRRRLLEAVLAEALGGRLPTAQEESHAAIA